MASNQNDTELARLVQGERKSGDRVVLGAEKRWRKENGDMVYDPKGSFQRTVVDRSKSRYAEAPVMYRPSKKTKEATVSPVARAQELGLPIKIRGNPLGCGCHEATLIGATDPVNSTIEADYMCDSGWHNFVVFQLMGFENKGEGVIKVDANGNLIPDTAIAPQELGEY